MSQVQTDRTLVPRVGGSVPTPRLLQFNITLVNPPSDRNCLIVPCISKLEDLHSHNVFLLGITMTMRDGLTSISSLLNPFYYPYQPMHCFLFSIISLFMLIFMIVYPIDNALHLFSIIWNVLSIISDMIPPIFPPG